MIRSKMRQSMRWIRAGSAMAVLTFITGVYCFAADGPSLDILTGEWLNREYVERLQATRSPMTAIKGIYFTGMEIEKQSDGVYDWLLIINFHEGVRYPLLGLATTDNKVVFEPIFGKNPENFITTRNRFRFTEPYPPGEIEWRFEVKYDPDESPSSYVRMPNGFDHFVTRTVIAGDYVDEEGETYIFTEDGVAVWPDTTFTFKIQVDTMFSEGDYFFVGKTHEERTRPVYFSYGYEWRDDRLYLYNTYNDEPVLRRRPEPFVMLTPVME